VDGDPYKRPRYNGKVRTLAEIPYPAQTIALFETWKVGTLHHRLPDGKLNFPYYWWAIGGEFWGSRKYTNTEEQERHQGGGNYVFLDGHAKWVRPEQTLKPITTDAQGNPLGNMWQWEYPPLPFR
jgi:prepilin-type processing-associated H-X9-DG protein